MAKENSPPERPCAEAWASRRAIFRRALSALFGRRGGGVLGLGGVLVGEMDDDASTFGNINDVGDFVASNLDVRDPKGLGRRANERRLETALLCPRTRQPTSEEALLSLLQVTLVLAIDLLNAQPIQAEHRVDGEDSQADSGVSRLDELSGCDDRGRDDGELKNATDKEALHDSLLGNHAQVKGQLHALFCGKLERKANIYISHMDYKVNTFSNYSVKFANFRHFWRFCRSSLARTARFRPLPTR